MCVVYEKMESRNNFHPILRCFLLILVSLSFVKGRIGSDVQEALENVPDWVKEYTQWHNIQRRDHMNDPDTKFLTIACHEGRMCGGISDRLRTTPFFLLLAKKLNRVLLIKWQKFDLESFLIPPDGGIDWRLPEGMDIGTSQDIFLAHIDLNEIKLLDTTLDGKKNLIAGKYSDLYARVQRQYFRTSEHLQGTFGYVWKLLFKPVPQLQLAIDKSMKDLNLQRGKYVSAHHRTTDNDLSKMNKDGEVIEELVTTNNPNHNIENSIACKKIISKTIPIVPYNYNLFFYRCLQNISRQEFSNLFYIQQYSECKICVDRE